MADSSYSTARLLSAWHRIQGKAQPHRFDEVDFRLFAANAHGACANLCQQISSGAYRPAPLQAVGIPKSSSGTRYLLIPPLPDRVVQSALAEWLNERINPRFSDRSFAYRPGLGVRQACDWLRVRLQAGSAWVIETDIADCFDSIDHEAVVEQLRTWDVWHNKEAWLLRAYFRSAVATQSQCGFDGPCSLIRGLPQGSPLSPLLCNVALHPLDVALQDAGIECARYADDLVLLAPTLQAAKQALLLAQTTLARAGLRTNDSKTSIHSSNNEFTFLGQKISVTKADSDVLPNMLAERVHDGIEHQPALAAATSDPSPVDRKDNTTRQITGEDGLSDDANVPEASDPLLRTLYLLEPHSTLERQGDTLVVLAKGRPDVKVPAARLHQVMAFGAANFTSGAVALCMEKSIPVMILNGRGRYFGVIDPIRQDNVPVQAAQFAALTQDELCLPFAKAVVAAKIVNSQRMLKRWHRRRPWPDSAETFDRLQVAQARARRCTDASSLHGVEGHAAAEYFKVLKHLIPGQWKFESRKRQPAPDPVNSMLSYGYTLLYYNLLTLIIGRGLNPYVGFYHHKRGRHHPLVSDLMEPFRAPVIDALVVDMVLNGQVKPDHFSWPEQDGDPCLMSVATRRAFIHAIEKKLNTAVQHPQYDTTLDYRRIMDVNVLQFVESLRKPGVAFVPFQVRA